MDDNWVIHECEVALLLIDVINDLEFEDGEKLVGAAQVAAENTARLKRAAKTHSVPCLYVNDNFGRWRSDFKNTVARCVRDGVRGAMASRKLVPEADDYFVLKPRHSGFYQTPLDLLLRHLRATKLILCGLTTDSCVLFTANDAYLRGYEIIIPEDCSAAIMEKKHSRALGQMRDTVKARTDESMWIDFSQLSKHSTPPPA
jgi:nicotinamidase-related amidase